MAGEDYGDWMSYPLVRHLHQIRPGSGAVETEQTANSGRLLAAAENTEAAAEIVYGELEIKLVKALNISAEKVDPDRPLHGIVVDLLVVVQLHTWILRHFNPYMPMFDLMEVASIRLSAVMIVARSGYVNKVNGAEELVAFCYGQCENNILRHL